MGRDQKEGGKKRSIQGSGEEEINAGVRGRRDQYEEGPNCEKGSRGRGG